MSFGLYVDGVTLTKGSCYTLNRVERAVFEWGFGATVNAYIWTIDLNDGDIYALGDTGGVFIYCDSRGGITKLLAREPVEVDVYVFKESKLSLDTGVGMSVLSESGDSLFTTNSRMLLLSDFRPYSLDPSLVENPSKSYSFKPKVVPLVNYPWVISSGQTASYGFTAYSVKGVEVRTAIATEIWREFNSNYFQGFSYDKRLPSHPYAVTR